MAIRVEVPTDRSDEKPEEVWLGDDGPFDFYPPKMGGLMDVALFSGPADQQELLATKATAEYIRDGFSEEDWAYIDGRLRDPEDRLDWNHLINLSQQVQAALANRPTTSSRGSSATRRQNTGAARPKRQASTSGDSESDDSVI